MREESFGPVFNPDGSPTDFTIGMLAGTGREPTELEANPTTDAQRAIWFGQAIANLVDEIAERGQGSIKEIKITSEKQGWYPVTWIVQAILANTNQPFMYVMYIQDDTGHMEMDG